MFINESKKSLGYVVRELVAGKSPKSVDFSSNLITKLVKDTIGPDAQSLFFCTLSPTEPNKAATIATLQFAEHAGKALGYCGEVPTSLTAEFRNKMKAYEAWIDYQNKLVVFVSRLKDRIIRSEIQLCNFPPDPEDPRMTTYLPDLDTLIDKPPNVIAALKATHVNYTKLMGIFGLTLNDGTKKRGGQLQCDKTAQLPNNLKRIDVYFTKGEHYLHSMVFTGDTVVHIGRTEDDDVYFGGNFVKDRVEVFELDQGETLLGCEIHHTKANTIGVTWLKWNLPKLV